MSQHAEWIRRLGYTEQQLGEPFAGYSSFDDCVASNQDADDPAAYCGAIKAKTESVPKKTVPKESLEKILIQERLRPFAASFFAAEPGTSENNREYSEEVLRRATPEYVGKHFIMDHNYMDSRSVQGAILRSNYETRFSPYTRQNHTGLWLDGVGLMDEELYQRMEGDAKKGIPPLVRGVSIGGKGEGRPTERGTVQVTNFKPMELSGTAFPGIPTAHVAVLAEISESIKAGTIKLQNTELPKASAPDPIHWKENQGLDANTRLAKPVGTVADAMKELSSNLNQPGKMQELPRSPPRRVSVDGRTVSSPVGMRASAPPLPVPRIIEENPTVSFTPVQVPQAAAEPPPITQTLPPTPPPVNDKKNELFSQAVDQREKELKDQIASLKTSMEKVEAELRKLGENGPTRGNTENPPAGIMPSSGLPGDPWLGGGGAPAAGPPQVPFAQSSLALPANPASAPPGGNRGPPWLRDDTEASFSISKTGTLFTDHPYGICDTVHPGMDHADWVQSEIDAIKKAMMQSEQSPAPNPNLHPIPTNPNFAPRADSPTLPEGMVRRYWKQPTRETVDMPVLTQSVAGNAVPRPSSEPRRRYHARTEDVMRTAQKHLETVQKQRPNVPLTEQVREAWFRANNEILDKTHKSYRQGPA